MLSKTIIAIPVHITSYGIMILIYGSIYGFDMEMVGRASGIVIVSWITLVLITLFKVRLESSFKRHEEMKTEAEKMNETFASLIYISSELSMYDELDTIYHMLIQRLVYMFPGASLALIVTKGEKHKFMNQVYHEVSNENQMFLKKHFEALIDPYALKKINITDDDMDIYKQWRVFNKDYSIRNQDGLTNYSICLFLRDLNVTDAEMNTLQIFMEQFKGSIRTRFQSIELERYATTDPLTKLYNRNSYYEHLQQLEDDYDEDKPFSLIFGDVNSLKYINDTYGHTDGDLLLKTCSELVQSVLAFDVNAYRYGGDEIVVIMRNTNIHKSNELIKAIEKEFMNKTIVCTNEQTHEQGIEGVSMCFGAACSSETPINELVDLADLRMRAKKDKYYEQKGNVRYR
jgi:diguanylate cyclase (GGDEF)-like protein